MPTGIYERKKCQPGCVCGRHRLAEYNRQRMMTQETRQKIGAATKSRSKGFYFSRGYRYLTGQYGHPIASKTGVVQEHRKILYDAIGPGVHPCHWCGKDLTWQVSLHVDHKDGDKTNNDRLNLVPSCQPCNTRRKTAGNPTDWSPGV